MDDLSSIVKEAVGDTKTRAEIAEITSLSAYQEKYHDVILRSEQQKISLRRWAVFFTLFALLAFLSMEILIVFLIVQGVANSEIRSLHRHLG